MQYFDNSHISHLSLGYYSNSTFCMRLYIRSAYILWDMSIFAFTQSVSLLPQTTMPWKPARALLKQVQTYCSIFYLYRSIMRCRGLHNYMVGRLTVLWSLWSNKNCFRLYIRRNLHNSILLQTFTLYSMSINCWDLPTCVYGKTYANYMLKIFFN